LPGDGAFIVTESALTLQEFGRVEHAPTRTATRWQNVMKHLVIHDVGDEVPWHPGPVQGRVQTDESVNRGITSQLDGLSLLGAKRDARSPRDERVHFPSEIALIDIIVDEKQIMVLAARGKGNPSPTAREASGVRFDEFTYADARL